MGGPRTLGLKLSASGGFLEEDSLHPPSQGGELGVLLHPGELDLAGRTVAVLADDDLGDALVIRVRVVVFVAVEEHYHVRVLLYGARIAKVGEQGPLVVALFDGSTELRYRQHGHVEVAGQDLQAAADLGYLLLAVLGAVPLPADHE